MQAECCNLADILVSEIDKADLNTKKLGKQSKLMQNQGAKALLTEIASIDRAPKIDNLKEFSEMMSRVEQSVDEESHFYLDRVEKRQAVFE